MGYTVQHGETVTGHYETREEVNEALKSLNGGTMPPLVHTSPGGIERYSDRLKNVISVIPDPVSE